MGVFSSPRVEVDIDGTATITVEVATVVDSDLAARIEDHWTGGMVQGNAGVDGRRLEFDDDGPFRLIFICRSTELASKEGVKATFDAMGHAWIDAVRERNVAATAAAEVRDRVQKLAENYPDWP